LKPMPSLAVAFTYYNEGPMLADAIAGLLAQPHAPDKVLVYDDASSDPARRHVPDDPRVIIERGERNKGPAVGRNRLLEASACDYIHFHDSDDYFDPHWSTAVRGMIAAGRPDVVLTDILPAREQPGETRQDAGWRIFAGTEPTDFVEFCILNALLVPCITISTAFARKMGGYPTQLHQSEDYLFSLQLAAAGPRIAFDPRPLAIVRQRAGSRSRTNRIPVFRDACRALELAGPILPERHRATLARSALNKGRTLYQLGDRAGARFAFTLAARFDPTSGRFADQPAHYRVVARALGPLVAEILGRVWRGWWHNIAARRGSADGEERLN
jgi:hypothetical protein